MKVSPLVKNNKILIVVLSVTFVCACVLIYESFSAYDDVQTIMTKIEEDDNAIQEINKRRDPNPVTESEKIILANTEKLREKVRDVRRRIGNPYRDALKDFLDDLESAAFLRSAPLPPKEFVDVRGPATVQPQPAAPAPAADAQAQAQTPAPAPAVSSSGREPVLIHLSEDDIRSSFADLYDEYYSDRKNADAAAARGNERLIEERNELFSKFREKLTEPPESMESASEAEIAAYKAGAAETFDKAFYHFQLQIQKNTIESIDQQDARFIFLEALGLPRTMTSLQCKSFVDEFLTRIRKDPSFIPGLAKLAAKSTSGQNDSGIESRIPSYTFDHKGKNPPPENVVHILRHYRILEDLFQRMRESNIQYLVSISSPFSEKPTGDLSGDFFRVGTDSDYRKFSYEVTIVSTGGEIRDFINRLHHAYGQNLVYDIHEISFFPAPQSNEVKEAYDKVDALRKQAAEGQKSDNPEPGTEGEPRASGSAEGQEVKTRTPEDIYADPEYGAVLVGQNELVTVLIKFNYILYVGEMLGMKKD